MKIKTKLILGIGLLFLLITLSSIVGITYINKLKSDANNILIDNFNSLQYAKNMLAALNKSITYEQEKFELNLKAQEKNITEIGEKELTQVIRYHFEICKQKPDSVIQAKLRSDIFKIIEMNMQAIERKNNIAIQTADDAVLWIGITSSLCFIIGLTLFVNLPSNIANLVKKLTQSIKQIEAKNYSERVHLESKDEFGELAQSFNSMAEKLQEYNNSNLAKIMMEKKRIEALINSMQAPVIGLDEKLTVIFVNEEALKIIGMKHNDLIGQEIQKLALENDLIRRLTQDLVFAQTENQRATEPMKIYVDNKEGYFEKETLNIVITPTGEFVQQTIGHVIILRNVTAYKELDFARTNFIATISHEFKTPIASIKMSLQLLENEQVGKLNEEQQQLLDNMKEDAERLLKITRELLNMAQVESGVIQMNIIPTNIKEIIEYSVNANKLAAAQKHINFNIILPQNLPNVLADTEKTCWVLINLISNAIRYSYDNTTIDINVSIENQTMKLEVKDTGQGIPPEYIDKIFNRYFRIPGTKKEGTGLGLSISKEFINAQGGDIKVKSDFGAGTTFTITLNCLTL